MKEEVKMAEEEKITIKYYMEKRLAQVYIPMQIYGETFDLRTALNRGTLFPELYRPYSPSNR